jgi:hypothetical protein
MSKGLASLRSFDSPGESSPKYLPVTPGPINIGGIFLWLN